MEIQGGLYFTKSWGVTGQNRPVHNTQTENSCLLTRRQMCKNCVLGLQHFPRERKYRHGETSLYSTLWHAAVFHKMNEPFSPGHGAQEIPQQHGKKKELLPFLSGNKYCSDRDSKDNSPASEVLFFIDMFRLHRTSVHCAVQPFWMLNLWFHI